MTDPPFVSAEAIAVQLGRRPSGEACAPSSISAALWDIDVARPTEIESAPDGDTYIVSIHNGAFRHETFIDGRLSYRQPARRGTANLITPWQRPRAILFHRFSCTQIYIPKDYLTALAEQVEMSRSAGLELRDPAMDLDPRIQAFGEVFRGALKIPSEFSRLGFDGLAQAFCLYLFERWSNAVDQAIADAAKGGLAPWQLRRVTEYMNDHLNADVSLATLAALVNLSPFHFARAFKRSVGRPPHAYHSALRMDEAKRLLTETDRSVTDIAFSVGYEAPQTLARVFQRELGTTPTAFRREQRP